MEKQKQKIWFLAVILNLTPLAAQCVLFMLGAGASVLTLCGCFVLNRHNCRYACNGGTFLIRSFIMCGAAYLGALINGRLYYTFISHDGPSLAVSQLFGWILVVALAITVAVSFMRHWRKWANKEKYSEQ